MAALHHSVLQVTLIEIARAVMKLGLMAIGHDLYQKDGGRIDPVLRSMSFPTSRVMHTALGNMIVAFSVEVSDIKADRVAGTAEFMEEAEHPLAGPESERAEYDEEADYGGSGPWWQGQRSGVKIRLAAGQSSKHCFLEILLILSTWAIDTPASEVERSPCVVQEKRLRILGEVLHIVRPLVWLALR